MSIDKVTMDDCVFIMDGNMWCCRLPDFLDMMQSPYGFGETQEEAFEEFNKMWEIGV